MTQIIWLFICRQVVIRTSNFAQQYSSELYAAKKKRELHYTELVTFVAKIEGNYFIH